MSCLNRDLYIARRCKLTETVKTGIIVLPGNIGVPLDSSANCFPFFQESSFLYFTGIVRENLILVIDVDENRETVFGDELTLDDIIWTGNLPSLSEHAFDAGINEIGELKKFEAVIDRAVNKKRPIHYLPNCRSEIVQKLSSIFSISPSQYDEKASKELIKAVISQREIKSEYEANEIEAAEKISYVTFSEIMNLMKNDVSESDIYALVSDFRAKNCVEFPFNPIITINGNIFHAASYPNKIKNSDLVVVDTGIKTLSGYCSDITRTLPGGGKFSATQKAIYEVVLSAQMSVINSAKPNIGYIDLHMLAAKKIVEGLKAVGLMKGNIDDAVSSGAHALFFPHGIGHMLGMEAHDMEVLGEDYVGYGTELKRSNQFGLSFLRLAKKIKPGFVMTVEPGIYFIPQLINIWQQERKFGEFINYSKIDEFKDVKGIRIEDNILVTDRGCRVLGDKIIPKTVHDIENMMST